MTYLTSGRTARAQDYITKARRIVARQQRLIAEIRACGGDSAEAGDLLSLFERSLSIFEDDLASILKNQGSRS